MATTFEKRRQNVDVLLLTPALIVIAAILGYPIVRSALLAFQEVKLRAGKLDQVWVGLGNFRRIFSDEGLQHAALNTLYFSVMEVILVVGIGLVLALLLNQPQGRSGFLKILLVMPWAIAPGQCRALEMDSQLQLRSVEWPAEISRADRQLPSLVGNTIQRAELPAPC